MTVNVANYSLFHSISVCLVFPIPCCIEACVPVRQLVIPLLILWHCFSHTQQQIYERPRQTKAGAQNNIDGVHSSPIQTHHMLKQHIHQYTTALLPLYAIPSPHCGNQGAEVPLYSHSVRHPVESKGTP